MMTVRDGTTTTLTGLTTPTGHLARVVRAT